MTNINNEKFKKIASDIRRDIHDNSQYFEDTIITKTIEEEEIYVITGITKLISKYSYIGVNTFNQENIFSKIIDSIVLRLGEPRGIPSGNKTNENNGNHIPGSVKCPKCQHKFVP